MNFSEVIGHKKNIKILKESIWSNRLAHALLFTGPSGIGKRRTAVITAAFLNCCSKNRNGACGECSSCRKLVSGTHPVIRFIGSPKNDESIEIEFSKEEIVVPNIVSVDDNSKNRNTEKINIYQIREVIRQASLQSYGRQNKIFIFDDISNISREGLNCLLKILEEPPAGTYLILITSRPESLFSTIISRCQRFLFNPLSMQEMKKFVELKYPDIDAQKTDYLLKLSSGSPGKFVKLKKMEDIDLLPKSGSDIFDRASRDFSNRTDCLEKLNLLLQKEGAKFRSAPSKEIYLRIKSIEDTIEDIKKNANIDLAVSNMFIKMDIFDILK